MPTLVIADLDTGADKGHHKAVRPQRGQNLVSTNYAITKWLVKETRLDKLLDLPDDKKEFIEEAPYKYSIQVAYQTPVTIDFKGTPTEALSSTFEDCLVYTNYDLFKGITLEEVDGSLVKEIHDIIKSAASFDALHEAIYKTLRDGQSNQKAEFALDIIYALDPKDITVPPYIASGLEWLQTLLHPEE